MSEDRQYILVTPTEKNELESLRRLKKLLENAVDTVDGPDGEPPRGNEASNILQDWAFQEWAKHGRHERELGQVEFQALGFNVKVDPKIPEGEIRFMQNGKPLGKIINAGAVMPDVDRRPQIRDDAYYHVKYERELRLMETYAGQREKDLLKACAIGMSTILVRCGAYESLSPYLRALFDELAAMHATCDEAFKKKRESEIGHWVRFGASASHAIGTTQPNALLEFVKTVASYQGEGPATTPWRDIVRDLGRMARKVLAETPREVAKSEAAIANLEAALRHARFVIVWLQGEEGQKGHSVRAAAVERIDAALKSLSSQGKKEADRG